MKITSCALLALALLFLIENHRVKSDLIGLGPCPTFNPAAVNADPFVSTTWFEQRRYPSRSEFLLRCVRYAFGPTVGAPVTHSISISGFRAITRRPITTSGTITQSAADAAANTFTRWTATFQSPFPLLPFFPARFPTTFTIVAVDAAANPPTWVALHSCRAVGALNIQNLNILTSVANPAANVIQTAIAAVDAQNFATDKLVTVTC